MSYSLQRRLENVGVTVSVVHPGSVGGFFINIGTLFFVFRWRQSWVVTLLTTFG